MVQAAWHSSFGSDLSKEILAKVDKCGSELSRWNRNVFGSVRQELNRKKNLLVMAENQAIISRNNQKVRELKSEINVLLDREARMWVQQSRLLWASQGDKNTKYFHSRATKRLRKNKIGGIRDEQDVWRVQLEEASAIIVNYYRKLFSSSTVDSLSSVLDHVP